MVSESTSQSIFKLYHLLSAKEDPTALIPNDISV